ncbi:hypothetical protein [Ruminococcus sp. FC2018]|uniref:hypothetical protein n=1 Tax=Ruminococcus sp. FC2018 TaxID=1410617 RepID=UPI00048C4878|nr:hypothetical protein [Ruminococcus sp. FC2018]
MRELKSNFGRYLALVLLIIMGVFLVVNMVGSADSIIDGTDLKAQEYTYSYRLGKGITDDELKQKIKGLAYKMEYECRPVGKMRMKGKKIDKNSSNML